MKSAIYPGSFDPITNGHVEIIERASKLFDKVYVLISINLKKKYIFTEQEKIDMVKKAISHLDNVEVVVWDSLVVSYASKVNASCIIRGIRNHNDFDNELELAYYNSQLNPQVETILLFPSTNNLFVSSSSIKELIKFNQDICKYVPSCIKEEIELKIRKRLQ